MRNMLTAIILAVALQGLGQLGVRSGTNTVYYSAMHIAPARIKERVTERHDATGYKLMDREGVFARLSDLVAEQVTVDGAYRVAAAWRQGFSNGVEELRAALNSAPTNGVYFGIEIPYDTTASRAAIDIYVASNHYDTATGYDMFWVYFNHPLPRPAVEIPYSWGGETRRVAATWSPPGTAANWTNTYMIARGGFEYECHLLFAERPTELSARAVMNLWPYGRLGNPETGIDWGQVQTTWKGRSTLTDLLTDGTNNWRFVNGHLMELTPVEGQE